MTPYPHVATDTDFGQIRPADFQTTYPQEQIPSYQDEHLDDAPNSRQLFAVLLGYMFVMVAIIVVTERLVTGNWF